MSTLRLVAALVLASPLPVSGGVPNGTWEESFDSYATGSRIAGQGEWRTWDDDPAFNTIVTDAQSFNAPHALLVAGSADVLQRYSNVEGSWDLYVNVYIPSTQTGEVWIRLANTYVPGGSANFSVRLVMCKSGCTTPGAVPGFAVNMGGSEVAASGSAPLATDQWVQVHVIVNSTPRFGYQYSLLYNNLNLGTFPWGVKAPSSLAAIEYRSNNSSAAYMDDMALYEFVPVEFRSFTVD